MNATATKRSWKDRPPAERRAEGKAKTEAALARLDDACRAIVEDDEAFAEYLRLSARMHGYSWGNRLLVMMQRPDAGLVAGFKRWTELERPVRKGSKGIQILAPMTIKHRDEATDEESRRVVGFRVAYVFSVHDTDGPPVELPTPIGPADDSLEAQEVARELEARCAQLGASVTLEHDNPAYGDGLERPAGSYNHAEAHITVNGDLPAAHRAKTLAHELAHHVAGDRAGTGDRALREIVAEGAAFVVAAGYGLATDGYSAPYVARWADGDLAKIRAALAAIADVAGAILQDRKEQTA